MFRESTREPPLCCSVGRCRVQERTRKTSLSSPKIGARSESFWKIKQGCKILQFSGWEAFPLLWHKLGTRWFLPANGHCQGKHRSGPELCGSQSCWVGGGAVRSKAATQGAILYPRATTKQVQMSSAPLQKVRVICTASTTPKASLLPFRASLNLEAASCPLWKGAQGP